MHTHTAVLRTEQKSPSAPLRRRAPPKKVHIPLGISGTTPKGDTCSSTGVWGTTGVPGVNEFLVAIPVFWFIIGVLGTANAMKNECFWCVEHYAGLYHWLLPPENEVWGKVIFSQACVKNSVHMGVPAPGGLLPGGACLGGCLVETPQDGYCCGRYASYWNAFLFSMFIQSRNLPWNKFNLESLGDALDPLYCRQGTFGTTAS